ncbi:ectonucleoside triphosphate diphosphohydrolase 3-like [Clytia hemisphaerica]|uniref:Ectonucleoside triphosphate diphosphohydrolase n=1 Tax=Clytia hemisphaerica TaxID=252671 RepID=A0A7M5X587_9CNID|eukprot:TCONS_00003208-protein
MCSCGVTLKRWFCIFMLISIALIISGLFFIIYGALNYEDETEDLRYQKADRVGAVIDAGGSATRLSLYNMNEKTKKFRLLGGKVFECEGKGIDHYNEDTYEELRNQLTNCLSQPFQNRLIEDRDVIPLYFGATGGMRLLRLQNKTLYNQTMGVIKDVLEKSSFKIANIKVLEGSEEAVKSWDAVNFMKAAANRKGIVELGSTSLQFIFEPDQSQVTPSTENVIEIKTTEGTKLLYRTSYLCFGVTEAERRVNAFLLNSTSLNESQPIDNPCYFSGYNKNITVDKIYGSACVSGDYARNELGSSFNAPPVNATTFLFRGTSDENACASLFEKVYRVNPTGPGFNDVSQPPVNGNFYGLSTLFYVARYMKLSSDAGLEQFRAKRDEICAKKWSELTLDKYTARRCFDSSYSYWLLTKGFNFPENSDQIKFIQKNEDNVNIIWSLGWIKEVQDDLYKRKGLPYRFRIITRRPNFMILLAIGVIFLIIGVVLLACSIKSKRSGREPVHTAEMY